MPGSLGLPQFLTQHSWSGVMPSVGDATTAEPEPQDMMVTYWQRLHGDQSH